MSLFLAAAVGAAFMVSLPASTAAEPSLAEGLAGKWTLNRDQSEDARAKMREAGGRHGGPGGHGGRGGFGGGRGGQWGGRSGAPADGAPRPDNEGPGTLRSFFEPPESLTIGRNGDEIAVNDGERIVILHPDGRKTKADDGRTELTAQWRGTELVVETRTERGRVTTAYMAVPDKRQLDVTSRFEGRYGEPVTVRRVYDAAVPE